MILIDFNRSLGDSLSLQLASSSSSHAECAGLIWDENNALRPRSCDVPGIK